jgi:hypothetical protein
VRARSFQYYFDALMSGNSERRRMLKFMPSDFKLIETRQPPLKDLYDEWLAPVICYAFFVPATPTRPRPRGVASASPPPQLIVKTSIASHLHSLDPQLGWWHSRTQWRWWAQRRSLSPPKISQPSAPAPTRARSGAPHRRSPRVTALDLFLPLMKVDLDRRLVTGVATAETPDRSGEICDYASSKPYFEKWSAEALAASGGKSLGAVRAMHGKIAAGKLTDIAFDDDEKRVVVAAKIVDDDEWRKVTEGVYTGFSQGGRYVKRWPDDTGLIRYTAEPHEISLVDLPCLPDATFEVVKDGVVEKRAFAQAERGSDAETGVAMPDGSYPIKTAEDVQNAVRDYERSGKRPEVKAHILARAKAIGAETALPSDWTAPEKAAVAASGGQTPDEAEALAKAAAALAEAAQKLERAADENARLRKSFNELSPALADLVKRVAALEAQPMPAKAALRAVAKSADGEAESPGAEDAIRRLAALPPDARALALTKLSLANPLRF